MSNINNVKVNGIDYSIQDTRVIDATTTVKGVVQLASSEELIEGMESDKVITISSLKAYFDNILLSPDPNESDFGGNVEVHLSSGAFIAPKNGKYLFIVTGGGNRGATNVNNGAYSGAGGGVIYGTIMLTVHANVSIIVGGAAGGTTYVQYLGSEIKAYGGKYYPISPFDFSGGSYESSGELFTDIRGFNGEDGKYDSYAYAKDTGLPGGGSSISCQGVGGSFSREAGINYTNGRQGSVIVIY